jgi:CRP-like cAMP-binding protein
MYLKQSDLFWQLSHDFVKTVMDRSTKQRHKAGDTLFREGDPARHFYVLIKGRVRLAIGDKGHVIHTVSRAGECFGWSALLEREVYSASAECREPTDLMLIDADRFTQIIEDDPANGLRFMKRLAGMLGNRLLQSYKTAYSIPSADAALSFGASHVSESTADMQ